MLRSIFDPVVDQIIRLVCEQIEQIRLKVGILAKVLYVSLLLSCKLKTYRHCFLLVGSPIMRTYISGSKPRYGLQMLKSFGPMPRKSDSTGR